MQPDLPRDRSSADYFATLDRSPRRLAATDRRREIEGSRSRQRLRPDRRITELGRGGSEDSSRAQKGSGVLVVLLHGWGKPERQA
jgi:hypothetical protein